MARFTERICLALPVQDNRTSPLPLETLKNDRFICLANTSSFRTLCDERCQEHGFKPHVIFESDNPSVVRKMIGLGLGVGFWPEHSWGTLTKKTQSLLLSTSQHSPAKSYLQKPHAQATRRYSTNLKLALLKNLQGHGAINSHHAPQLHRQPRRSPK